MVYRPWDWRIANKRTPLKPHYPQWSFTESKDCAKFNALCQTYRDVKKCDPICRECSERNAANDYMRGVSPHNAPHYPLPVPESVNLFALWCMDELESDWNMRFGDWMQTQETD